MNHLKTERIVDQPTFSSAKMGISSSVRDLGIKAHTLDFASEGDSQAKMGTSNIKSKESGLRLRAPSQTSGLIFVDSEGGKQQD